MPYVGYSRARSAAGQQASPPAPAPEKDGLRARKNSGALTRIGERTFASLVENACRYKLPLQAAVTSSRAVTTTTTSSRAVTTCRYKLA